MAALCIDVGYINCLVAVSNGFPKNASSEFKNPMVSNSNDIPSDHFQSGNPTICGASALRAHFQEQDSSLLFVSIDYSFSFSIGIHSIRDEFGAEYKKKKEIHDLLFTTPYPPIEEFIAKRISEKRKEHLNLGIPAVDHCPSESIPVDVERAEDCSTTEVSNPTKSRASLDKAARKRFRRSFLLSGCQAQLLETAVVSSENETVVGQLETSNASDCPNDFAHENDDSNIQKPLMIDLTSTYSELPQPVDTSSQPVLLQKSPMPCRIVPRRMILSVDRKARRPLRKELSSGDHVASERLDSGGFGVGALLSDEQKNKAKKISTNSTRDVASENSNALAQKNKTIKVPNVPVGANQKAINPLDRNGKRRLIAAEERKRQKRNEAQRRYRQRRALKMRQQKEEAEKKIKSLIGNKKSERRRITQYNLESLRFMLLVGAIPIYMSMAMNVLRLTHTIQHPCVDPSRLYTNPIY